MTLLNSSLLASSLLIGGLSIPPTSLSVADPPAIESVRRSRPQHSSDYPRPDQGMVLTDTEESSIIDLLDSFAAVTGEHIMFGADTEALLKNTRTGVRGDLVIAPEDVYSTVQDLLVMNRLTLTDVRRSEPRVLMVQSLDSPGRSGIRANARYVDINQIQDYARDSALLVTTAITLENIEARSLGNSLRHLVVDSNTLQLIPIYDTRQVVVTGFGKNVVDIIALLRDLDREAATVLETKRAEAAAEAARQAAKGEGKDGLDKK